MGVEELFPTLFDGHGVRGVLLGGACQSGIGRYHITTQIIEIWMSVDSDPERIPFAVQTTDHERRTTIATGPRDGSTCALAM